MLESFDGVLQLAQRVVMVEVRLVMRISGVFVLLMVLVAPVLMRSLLWLLLRLLLGLLPGVLVPLLLRRVLGGRVVPVVVLLPLWLLRWLLRSGLLPLLVSRLTGFIFRSRWLLGGPAVVGLPVLV